MANKINHIFLNGRFLTQVLTGVQRTAVELTLAIDELIDSGKIDSTQYRFYLIYSGRITNQIDLKHIKFLKKGLLRGNLWEQLELPLFTWGSLLVSMCSMSPIFKRRQIVVIHDVSPFVNPAFFSKMFRTWYKIAYRILGRISERIVTVSNFSKNELIKRVGVKSAKVSVIYNAADHILRLGDPDECFKEKIQQFKPYCLAVSSLGANKNFRGLIEAVNKTDLHHYNTLIAGGRPATLASTLPEKSSAHYLGYVTDKELKYLYTNAALFIFPSFYEGFGIPPLEAMSCGCPVLASNSSSLPEVLQEACVYCDPYDTDDIAAKITSLITNPLVLAELKLKGQKLVKNYRWKISAENLFRIIQLT